MAEALAGAARDRPAARVVGLMGSGHVVHGYGVEHPLRDLGVADAVFGIEPVAPENGAHP